MSPTSYQTAPPRNVWNSVFSFQCCDVGYECATIGMSRFFRLLTQKSTVSKPLPLHGFGLAAVTANYYRRAYGLIELG